VRRVDRAAVGAMQALTARSARPGLIGAASAYILSFARSLVTPASSHKLLDGKYEIVRLLGKGGMGAVYEARHRATGRRVAVKLIAHDRLPLSAGILDRFQREALLSGAIESQYVAQILDAGVDALSGQPYMALELLTGEDLHRAIARIGGISPDLALRIAAQACLGLQRAHEAGVTHRDIKPANLFLARRDGDVVVKVLDFGLAKAKCDLQRMHESDEEGMVSTSGAIIGSPAYMSPEQVLGQKTLDHRTDLWSLGVVLYQMLAGRTPTEGAATAGELILRICTHPPRPLRELAPTVAPEVAAIVHRALAREPPDRFATAAAMYEAIRVLLPNGQGLEESMFPSLPARTPSDAPAARGEVSALHDASTLTPEEDAGLRAARSSPPPIESRMRAPTNKIHLVTWDDVFVLVDYGEASPADYANLGATIYAAAEKYPRGIGGLAIIPSSARPPSPEARSALNKVLREPRRAMRCFCWCVEGTGFQGAMVRAVLTGMRMFGPLPYESQVTSELREALGWIVTTLDGNDDRLATVSEGARWILEQRRKSEKERPPHG
jgi:serine/threonine protein kinase